MIAAYQRISRADGDLGKDGKDKSNSITVLRGFSICWAVCYWQRRFFRTSCISRKEWKHFKC